LAKLTGESVPQPLYLPPAITPACHLRYANRPRLRMLRPPPA
jgi:hypothetical protein